MLTVEEIDVGYMELCTIFANFLLIYYKVEKSILKDLGTILGT